MGLPHPLQAADTGMTSWRLGLNHLFVSNKVSVHLSRPVSLIWDVRFSGKHMLDWRGWSKTKVMACLFYQ
jgi:hypothetical protein